MNDPLPPEATPRANLANLYVEGLAVEQDDRHALDLVSKLADRGFQSAAWLRGFLLDQLGRADEAATAFARCWALGHPEGYYSLGLRFALGAGVGADRAFARALLIRAADARAAADEHCPRDEYGREAKLWYDRMKACHRAAQPMFERLGRPTQPGRLNPLVTELEAHFARLGHAALCLDAAGRLRAKGNGGASLAVGEQSWEWVSERPRVATCATFATREECTHLIQMILPHLTDPRAYRRGNAYGDLTYFSGEGCPVGPMEADAVIRKLERRIARMTKHPLAAL